MQSEIYIKSVAANRVRLKSKLFSSDKNLSLIQTKLSEIFLFFRANKECNSIIFKYNDSYQLEDVIDKIKNLFSQTISISKIASQSVCNSQSSCNAKANSDKSWNRKLIEFGLLSGYAIYLFVSEHILGLTIAATPLSVVAIVSVVAAIPLIKESIQDIKEKKFTLHTFMGGTLLLAIFFGEATAAFEIIYILRGGMLLEEYISLKSKKEIHKLVELDVQKAYVLVDGVEVEVEIDDVKSGDIIVCRSGDKIPVDGVVVDGSASLNEAIINGRSSSTLKKIGDDVFAGTLCQTGRVSIQVSAIGSSTYISRVMSDVENSLSLKSKSELEADRLAAKLLKLGSLLTVGTFLLTGSFMSAFSVMIVMSCPCATVLAASTAISGGIAKGAKEGILIKGGEALEKVSQSEVFCFDKTGTLTTGEPTVKEIYTLDGIEKNEFLEYVAIAEYRNDHPIAKAILAYVDKNNISIKQNGQSENYLGLGVKSKYDSQTILVGNKQLLSNHKISIKNMKNFTSKHSKDGDTIVYVAVDKELLGALVLRHQNRAGIKNMLDSLREKGVKHIVLLSGDEKNVANSFAERFGFDEVFSEQSPTDKANTILELKRRYNNVVMVGDGVNDTLAMSKADVAVSFAAGGSKAAIEASSIAISHSHPEDVVELYDISKKTLNVVNQNYWIGTGTNLIGVGFAALGMLSPVAAGAIHIGHTVGIMVNSARLGFDNNS